MSHDGQLDVCLEKWKAVDKHLDEAVIVRDRIKTVELRLALIEKQVMKNAIIGGIIGALLGSSSPQLISAFISFVLKVG